MSSSRGKLDAMRSCLPSEPLEGPGLPARSFAAVPPAPVLRDLDLRVYTPIPEVVIVRVGGCVDCLTGPVLTKRVANQLLRASHVVIDLGEVTAVDPRGLAGLRTLHHQASAHGTQIHLVRAQGNAVCPALRITGLDKLFPLHPTAETIVAEIRA
jgi:anti-anti-sigma factor